MESTKFAYTPTLRRLGISYLGKHSQSMKMTLSTKNGVCTYCLYLAPYTMSGHNVCPGGQHCHKFCLNGSGHNKSDIMFRGEELSTINQSRVKKTRLFYEDRATFMRLMIHEIIKTRKWAASNNLGFAVRINGTSDLSPELFIDPDTGMNILDLFYDVQFYDYTKVESRYKLVEKYSNYHLTFSYDGHNMDACKRMLERGINVAVVFENTTMLPMKFMGVPVIDGNLFDMRYFDPQHSIVGLHYHKTAANYDKQGNYIRPNEDFVIRDDHPLVEWYEE